MKDEKGWEQGGSTWRRSKGREKLVKEERNGEKWWCEGDINQEKGESKWGHKEVEGKRKTLEKGMERGRA